MESDIGYFKFKNILVFFFKYNVAKHFKDAIGIRQLLLKKNRKQAIQSCLTINNFINNFLINPT